MPQAKHISVFNGLIVLANLKYTSPTGFNTAESIVLPFSLNWSDSSLGGSQESFPALNAYNFNDSEFDLSGVFGTDDVLIASKRDKIFFISGNLTNGNYIVRDSISEGIGCVSGNSFMKVDSGAIFMSERGLYWTVQGSKPVEFSSEVSPILRSGIYDLTKSSSDLDTQRELIYISLPHKTDPTLDLVLVYSFKWKEWFTYTGYQVKASLTVFNNKIIHTDGVNVYEENTSFNDNGVAIPAKWSTSWLGNSEAPHTTILPYNFSIISLGETAWDCTFSTDSNFSELYPTTEISLDFDAPSKIICQDGDLDKQAVYSFRINLKNDILNEDFRIDSLSINAEPRQMMEKGDE